MWKLLPTKSGGEAFYLLPGKEYVVGRKNCDILLGSDQSISRHHAQISVNQQTLTVKDCSKYGTFVNNVQLQQDCTKMLDPGDVVRFGVFNSKYSVEQERLRVCSSCLDTERKAELSLSVCSLGGLLVSSWDEDCTHLVMPTVKITIKTVCALLSCRPIVSLGFFSEFTKALQQKQTPPKPDSFFPEINEPSLAKEDVDLGTREERRQLFNGKTFIFLNSKQMKRLSQAVSCGGGKTQLLEEGSVPPSLAMSGSCMVKTEANSQISISARKWIDAVSQLLQREGLRWISESEIGLAAIYINTHTYCNPKSHTTPATVVEPVMMNSEIPCSTISMNATVDDTVNTIGFPNITAYAVNTEPSQGISRPDVSGVTSVGETPEKQTRCTTIFPAIKASTTKDHMIDLVPPGINITDAKMLSVSLPHRAAASRLQKADHHVQESRSSLSCSAANKTSPQSSLTSFFLPISKKRPHSKGSDQREAKLSKSDAGSEKAEENFAPFTMSSNMGTGSHHSAGDNCDLALIPGICHGIISKKRKEMVKDQPMKPASEPGLDLSLEELESIMTEDMEEPSNKKPCLDKEEQDCSVREEARTEQEERNTSSVNQKSKCAGKSSAIQKQKEQEGSTFSQKQKAESEDVKEEEESFVVDTKLHLLKNDPELPQALLQVHFKNLTVSQTFRMKANPRQPNEYPNSKNFKRFCKTPVPGTQGLPHIIGGSDLVAHNRARSSEIEDWLREAAEEEKLNEQEQTLGDELFRYNPKRSKRR
ncbi:nibrin isoform X2 [Denticeps clupeoides]|uniref:nibrin isoform X2 n=1 Tax=Denticeps clupeoides TaxID=299321 RepID=UPI0010A3642E|nr:nibrin isoform X2 [Denticeps clupeoides]